MQQRATHISCTHECTHTLTHTDTLGNCFCNLCVERLFWIEELISFYLKLSMNSVTIWHEHTARNHSWSDVAEDVTTSALARYVRGREADRKTRGRGRQGRSERLQSCKSNYSVPPVSSDLLVYLSSTPASHIYLIFSLLSHYSCFHLCVYSCFPLSAGCPPSSSPISSTTNKFDIKFQPELSFSLFSLWPTHAVLSLPCDW